MILLQFEVTEMSLPVVVLGKCDASHVDWKHSVLFSNPITYICCGFVERHVVQVTTDRKLATNPQHLDMLAVTDINTSTKSLQ